MNRQLFLKAAPHKDLFFLGLGFFSLLLTFLEDPTIVHKKKTVSYIYIRLFFIFVSFINRIHQVSLPFVLHRRDSVFFFSSHSFLRFFFR